MRWPLECGTQSSKRCCCLDHLVGYQLWETDALYYNRQAVRRRPHRLLIPLPGMHQKSSCLGAQVMQLAKDLGLAQLLARAELAITRGPWEGSNRQDIINMLNTLPVPRVHELVHCRREPPSDLSPRHLVGEMQVRG